MTISRPIFRAGRERFGVDLNDPRLAFYSPLWHPSLSGSPFISQDIYRASCTVTGATWGITGRTFDGTDGKIVLASSTGLTVASGGITIACAIYPTGANDYILGKPISNASYGNYSLTITAAQKLAFGYDGTDVSAQNWASADALPLNQWGILVVSFTFGTGGSILVTNNGAAMAGSWTSGDGSKLPKTTGTQAFELGHWLGTGAGAGYWFGGVMGDALVYKRAFAIAEMVSLTNGLKWRYV